MLFRSGTAQFRQVQQPSVEGEVSPRQQEPRDWLRQTAGAAAPPGGRALDAVSNRGGHLLAYLACFFDLVFEVTLKTERDAGHQSDRSK